MSNILNYTPEILHNIYGFLSRLEANQGKITTKFIKSEIERLKGQWPSEVINVSLVVLGQKPAVSGMVATDAEVKALVEMAQKDYEYIIGKIKAQRNAREQAKEATKPDPQIEEEPTITIVDLEDEDEFPHMTPEELEYAGDKGFLPYRPLTVGEATDLLLVSAQRVRALCAEGRFPDAHKHGNAWVIPSGDALAFALSERRAGRPAKGAHHAS